LAGDKLLSAAGMIRPRPAGWGRDGRRRRVESGRRRAPRHPVCSWQGTAIRSSLRKTTTRALARL